ncbi:hypothetical protein F4860DRAFT_510274 [Xylaria cubensis]|nr:hypothetical protein F4860DRAFT_510274 [Xylaria cubensis]
MASPYISTNFKTVEKITTLKDEGGIKAEHLGSTNWGRKELAAIHLLPDDEEVDSLWTWNKEQKESMLAELSAEQKQFIKGWPLIGEVFSEQQYINKLLESEDLKKFKGKQDLIKQSIGKHDFEAANAAYNNANSEIDQAISATSRIKKTKSTIQKIEKNLKEAEKAIEDLGLPRTKATQAKASDQTGPEYNYPRDVIPDWSSNTSEEFTVNSAAELLKFLLRYSSTNQSRNRKVEFGGRIWHNSKRGNLSNCLVRAIDDGGLDLTWLGPDKKIKKHRFVILEAKRCFDKVDKDGRPELSDKVLGQLARQAMAQTLEQHEMDLKGDKKVIVIFAVQCYYRFFEFTVPKRALEKLATIGYLKGLDPTICTVGMRYTKWLNVWGSKTERETFVLTLEEILMENFGT